MHPKTYASLYDLMEYFIEELTAAESAVSKATATRMAEAARIVFDTAADVSATAEPLPKEPTP
jgi:hypothetical protein